MTTTEFTQKYRILKAKHPDAVYIFRKDNWDYEMYYEDAQAASEILAIPIQKIAGTDIPLINFNGSCLDEYLSTLVRTKKRVAICEPLEEPKKIKR